MHHVCTTTKDKAAILLLLGRFHLLYSSCYLQLTFKSSPALAPHLCETDRIQKTWECNTFSAEARHLTQGETFNILAVGCLPDQLLSTIRKAPPPLPPLAVFHNPHFLSVQLFREKYLIAGPLLPPHLQTAFRETKPAYILLSKTRFKKKCPQERRTGRKMSLI